MRVREAAMISSRGSMRRWFVCLTAALFFAIGCGGLSVTKVGSVQAKPSNVGIFLAVENDGQPVTGLTADDFTIYEDGLPVPKADTRVVLHDPSGSSARYTLVLVDRSAAGVAAIPSDTLMTDVGDLVARLEKVGRVGVYAFDGDDRIHPILPFSAARDEAAGKGDKPEARDKASDYWLDRLGRFAPKDPSSNLHGATILALKELKRALERDRLAIRFGSLVVLASGPDRAGRRTRDEVKRELSDDAHARTDVYALGAGPHAAEADLRDIGRTGTHLQGPGLGLQAALDKAASAIELRSKRYYVLSYCTPSRKGARNIPRPRRGRSAGTPIRRRRARARVRLECGSALRQDGSRGHTQAGWVRPAQGRGRRAASECARRSGSSQARGSRSGEARPRVRRGARARPARTRARGRGGGRTDRRQGREGREPVRHREACCCCGGEGQRRKGSETRPQEAECEEGQAVTKRAGSTIV
jgi:hypothetical protein